MKKILIPPALILLAGAAAAAPIALTGAMHYSQNFDSLAKSPDNNFVSTTPVNENWNDDGTIPGWYFYQAGNGTAENTKFAGTDYPYRVTDGSLQVGQPGNLIDTGWFYSMGTVVANPANADRALGVVPISAKGELSYLAVFQNTAAEQIRLEQIAYNAEVWRTNQNSQTAAPPNNNTKEAIIVWWRTAATQAELLNMTVAATSTVTWDADLATAPNSQYVTGWNRVPNADFKYTSVLVNTKTYESHPVSALPAAPIDVPPGQFLALRWGNLNDRDADALMGIDDLDLTFSAGGVSPPFVQVSTASNIMRNLNGPGSADDTVSFDVTVTGTNGGTGWTTTNATPASGAFGLVNFTVPAGGFSAKVRVTDNTFPAVFADVTVPLPGPYAIGSYDLGAGVVPLFPDTAAPPDPAWVLSGTPPTLTMNGLNLAAPFKTVTSEVITVTGAVGALKALAHLHVHDTTGGFEPADEFNAYVILDGIVAAPVSMISAWNPDSSATMAGPELCPVPPVNPTVQDLDYPLSANIPAGTNTVQIVITGLCNSTNETMIVSGISVAAAAPDADSDGMSDAYEDANGLDKNSNADRDLDKDGDGQSNYLEFVAGTAASDPASFLHVIDGTLNTATGAGSSTWTSVAGKRYRIQLSPDLATWTDAGSTVTAAGATTTAGYTLPGAPLTGKGYLRVKVVP